MKTLTVDDAALRSLAANPAVAAAFPFLASLRGTRQPVGCCGKSSSAATGGDMAAARSALAGLPPERRTELKRLLGVERIYVFVIVDKEFEKVTL